MLQIHPNARTTPVTRAEIARSSEPSGTLAKRYGVSAETIRKWRKRGASECQDRSARPHRLPWKATDEERAVVCALRQSTNFPLDDLTFVVTHFLPHLNRDSVWRILRSEGLSRRRPPVSTETVRGKGIFRDYDLGFIHIDIKHLPKLQAANGERRKRYLYVAIDRCSRSVHLAVKDDETEKSAIAFLREVTAAFPFRVTHVLTDNGSCFTPAFERTCAQLGADYRHTRPRTPQTNGMVERFNGRIGSEVLGITIYSHRDLEQLLRGFNAAYNARRQRVLNGKTPDQVVAERLEARPQLNKPTRTPQGRAGPCDITKARLIADAAKEVSQPDMLSCAKSLLLFPFRVTHALTDNGSCFTPAFERTCAQLGADYRHTRPRTPQTNGMVERFNGRIGSEVLGITIYSHRDLEQLLRGFNAAYNARRQRVLNGKTPDQVVAERLEARPQLNKPTRTPQGRAGPCDITKARLIADAAKEVSQPDN